MIPADKRNKERKTDRVVFLKAEEGATSSTGLVDPRLFNGENKLHIIMDPRTTLWSFKYEHGGVPGALKNKFTTFETARKHAEKYFTSRGIKIDGILD